MKYRVKNPLAGVRNPFKRTRGGMKFSRGKMRLYKGNRVSGFKKPKSPINFKALRRKLG